MAKLLSIITEFLNFSLSHWYPEKWHKNLEFQVWLKTVKGSNVYYQDEGLGEVLNHNCCKYLFRCQYLTPITILKIMGISESEYVLTKGTVTVDLVILRVFSCQNDSLIL